jgi:tetratricopeptide (TPR) repeat protein
VHAKSPVEQKEAWCVACTRRRHASNRGFGVVKPRVRTLMLVAFGVIALIATADLIGRMSGRFFGTSPFAAWALAHYLVGDYAGAARFYREDLRRAAAAAPAPHPTSWAALVASDLDRAEAQARMEAQLAPTDPEPLLTLAEVALARGDWSSALAQAGRVLELQRDDYDALLLTTVARARQGAFHPAIDALKRALRYDRTERRGTVFLTVLEVTGELDDRPIEARPNCLLAHLHRYLRIFDPSQARSASRYAQRAIETGDRPDDAHVTLALIHTKQGRPSRAHAAFQQALAINPGNTAALLGSARYRANRGELAEEYRLMRAAFDADRDDPFVIATFHGFLVDKLGDYRQALTLAEAAIAHNARDAEAWWRSGHVHTQLGDHRRALHSYQQAAALAPRTAELEENIGNVLIELGRDEEAFAAYRRAISLDPLRPQPHFGLGVLYGKARRWNEAIQELEIVARLGGGLAVGLCEMYLETGRPDDAARCVTAVLTADPENTQGLALLEHVRGAQRSASAKR